jgi:cephalosporin hydroxylase
MSAKLYEAYLGTFSTSAATRGHLVRLHNLAKECSEIVEVGVENVITTFAFLSGLRRGGRLTSIDIQVPPATRLELAVSASREAGIEFNLVVGSDLEVDVPPCDLLFLDGFHSYQHVITELRVLQGRVRKYICLHDTSPPWDHRNETYIGDHREHPGSDKSKQGVWTAVEDFLAEHPHWRLKERYHHSHGLTILQVQR